MTFQPTLESVRQHKLPDWFQRAKLGIFIHWGLYSVPAWAPPGQDIDKQIAEKGWRAMFANNPYAEWYLNSLRVGDTPTQQYHRATYGKHFSYDDFVPVFNREVKAWNAEEWALLFRRIGARYVVLTTKHHDGFLLWNSAHTSPYKGPGYCTQRDLVGELTNAVRQQGLHMGLYYSGGLDWTFSPQPVLDLPDVHGTIVQTPEFIAYANAHFRELIDRYAPSILWNDIGYPAAANSAELFAYYYNNVPEGVVNDRWAQSPIETVINEFGAPVSGVRPYHCDYVTPEYTTYSTIQSQPWEICRGIGHSFGYNQTEGSEDYLSVEALVHLLCDVVSKNGNLLLNVGPKADGSIPELQRERLIGLGDWLTRNGEAIFNTTPWSQAEGVRTDGIALRFTQNAESLYAILLDRPSACVALDSTAIDIPTEIHLLGWPKPLSFKPIGNQLHIDLPAAFDQQSAYVLRLTRR